jgi:GMP synthase-like glutamine amidotransferase
VIDIQRIVNHALGSACRIRYESVMRLHSFEHVPYEGLDRIGEWAKARGHAMTATCFYEEARLPPLEDWDLLCVMGGPMAVYEAEEIPWMPGELAYIEKAIAHGKRILGICLGSQLIAAALGAKVYPQPQKEIGWWPVHFLPAARGTPLQVFGATAMMYHWHGDTFDLPAGATLLASSDACAHQAYAVGRNVLALQFHPEISFDTIGRWVQQSNSIKTPGGFVQSEAEMKRLAPHFLATLYEPLYRFLDACEQSETALPATGQA